MTTGEIESFAANMADIGPLYPFVGWEMLLVVLTFVFWLGWHVRQYRMEKREYEEDLEQIVNREVFERVFRREETDPGL